MLSRPSTLDDQIDDDLAVGAAISVIPVDPPGDEDVVDLLGNPVSAAVAKYQFDKTGSLYESHSPQTELPRLAPPKT